MNASSDILKLLCLENEGRRIVNDESVEEEDEKSETFIVDMNEGEVLADTDTGEVSPDNTSDFNEPGSLIYEYNFNHGKRVLFKPYLIHLKTVQF